MLNLVKLSTIKRLKALLTRHEILLAEAVAENDRLFTYHNDRLTNPRRDKSGKLRNRNGQFARES